MGRRQKLFSRFLLLPKDFKWDELLALMRGFGFQEVKQGKTGGSRRRFLHKGHPGKILKKYQMEFIKDYLEKQGLI